MNTIGLNNSSTNTALINATLTNSSETQVAEVRKTDVKQDLAKHISSNSNTNESLKLSSRSEKLQAISKQFFSGSNLVNIDVKELIEKVYEYELISDEQYQSLKNNPLFKWEDNKSEDKKIDSLVESLQSVRKVIDSSNSINKAQFLSGISDAITILSDVEKAKTSPTFKQDIANAMNQLEKFTESESFKKLESKQQDSVEWSIAALEVIDKISPKRLSNPSINRYLDFIK